MISRRNVLRAMPGLCPLLADAQCQTMVLDQRTYRSTGVQAHQGRVYLHTGDIDSIRASPGFKPFDVHIIVGLYRAPFLGSTGVLSEQDRERLLSGRSGLWRDRLAVTRLSAESKVIAPPGLPRFLLRVKLVIPAERGTDRVVIEICPPS